MYFKTYKLYRPINCVSEALARSRIFYIHVHDLFFLSVHLGGLAPPPPPAKKKKKTGYATAGFPILRGEDRKNTYHTRHVFCKICVINGMMVLK